MREIKFRAWDNMDKVMRYTFLGKSGDEDNDWILFFAEFDVDKGNKPVFGGLDNPYPRQRFELMQYIGLKDKNWKEIYERDMLCHWDNLHTHKGIGQVIYNGSGFYLDQGAGIYKLLDSCYAPCDMSIVIGNIWENPELVRGKWDLEN